MFRSEDVWTTGRTVGRFGSDVDVPLRLICNLVLMFGTQRRNDSKVVSAPINPQSVMNMCLKKKDRNKY